MSIQKISPSFQHCPKCGQDEFTQNKSNSMRCAQCGFEFFFNAAAAVAALIVDDQQRLLVVVRGRNPGKGLLDLPGGFVDAGESAETALAREVKEELNLDVDSMQYFASTPNEYLYKDVTYETLDLTYICHISNFSQMQPMDDVAEVLLIDFDQIEIERFAFDSIRKAVSSFLKTQR